MRRLLAVFLLCSTVGLIAATPAPRFTPLPNAAPTFTPGPVATGNGPTVLVYPFETPSDLDNRYGTAVAKIYDQVLTETGGLKILPSPANIKREDYAKVARVQHADYYISGYIQPIGSRAAIVMQIVDVQSDIAVYAQTTQVESVPDVASQALYARSVILQHSGIESTQIATVKQTPTPSATQGASVSITSVLGDLFKGKGKGKAVAARATPDTAPKPSRGMIVTHVTGAASSTDLSNASAALVRDLDGAYTVRESPVAITNLAKQADGICGASRDNTVVAGELLTNRIGGFHPHNTYTFTLTVAACFGATLYTNTQTGDDLAKIVKAAARAYATDHPNNN